MKAEPLTNVMESKTSLPATCETDQVSRSTNVSTTAKFANLVTPSLPIGREASVSKADRCLPGVQQIATNRWCRDNCVALNAWMQQLCDGAVANPSAAFDWDNTCIGGDTNLMTLHDLVDRLLLRLTPDELAASLPDEIRGHQVLYSGASLTTLKADILAAYAVLWPMMQDGRHAEARETSDFIDFRAKLMTHYEGVLFLEDDHPESDGNLPHYFGWLKWLKGFTPSELQSLTVQAFKQRESEPAEARVWVSATDGASGPQTFRFMHGAARRPEMVDLVGTFASNGITPYIMTGGIELCVQALAEGLGYDFASQNIHGTRLAVGADGRLTGERECHVRYPAVWNAGKTQRVYAVAATSGPTVFAAGDSDADFHMLTALPHLQMRLVINRHSKGAISKLYEEAYRPTEQVKTLLQGFHPDTLGFNATRDSHA